MTYTREYLVSYNFQAKDKTKRMVDGWGSLTITVTFKSLIRYLRGYRSKDLHNTRVLIANALRKSLGGVPRTHRAKVVVMNIIKLPIK